MLPNSGPNVTRCLPTSSWVGLQSATDREWPWEKTKFHRPRLSSRFACGDRYNVSWTTYLFSVSKETIRQGGATHLPEAPCHSLHVLFLLDHEDDSLTVSSSRRIRSQTTRNSTQSFCFLANSTHRLDTETQLSKGGIHPRTTNWKRASFFWTKRSWSRPSSRQDCAFWISWTALKFPRFSRRLACVARMGFDKAGLEKR